MPTSKEKDRPSIQRRRLEARVRPKRGCWPTRGPAGRPSATSSTTTHRGRRRARSRPGGATSTMDVTSDADWAAGCQAAVKPLRGPARAGQQRRHRAPFPNRSSAPHPRSTGESSRSTRWRPSSASGRRAGDRRGGGRLDRADVLGEGMVGAGRIAGYASSKFAPAGSREVGRAGTRPLPDPGQLDPSGPIDTRWSSPRAGAASTCVRGSAPAMPLGRIGQPEEVAETRLLPRLRRQRVLHRVGVRDRRGVPRRAVQLAGGRRLGPRSITVPVRWNCGGTSGSWWSPGPGATSAARTPCCSRRAARGWSSTTSASRSTTPTVAGPAPDTNPAGAVVDEIVANGGPRW